MANKVTSFFKVILPGSDKTKLVYEDVSPLSHFDVNVCFLINGLAIHKLLVMLNVYVQF